MIETRFKLRTLGYAWVVAEVLVSSLLIYFFGWLMPVVLWLAGAAVGVALLTVKTPLRILTGVLLLMPGLVSSLLGLALFVRPLRARIIQAAGLSGLKSPTGAVDLDPKDWKRDEPR